MEIVLLRHGRPRIDTRRRLSAAEFGLWLHAYDAAGLDAAGPPPPGALAQAESCNFALCSDLPRAIESAGALGRMARRDTLFRELGMPRANWRFPRLPPGAWAVLFRLLWLAGYAPATESFGEARERARACAVRLAELAAEHGKVLFVGHGALNWLIAGHLGRMGWAGPPRPSGSHWAFSIYRYP